jgi:signal transduction histidine kinase
MSKIISFPQLQKADDGVGEGLYENSPDCIKVLSFDGTIKRLSPSGQVALELDRPDQLDGAHWPSLWPGSEQRRVEQAMADARDGRRTQFLAFCPTAKNTPRWWDVVVSPLSGPEGGALAVSRDVTDLVRVREELTLVNERKNQFMTVLSHELRNPLSTLSMAMNLLEARKEDPIQVSRVVETMKRQIAHMSRLAEDLLDISRITRGEVSLRMADFDVREAVQEATEQLSAMTSTKGQQIRQDITQTTAQVRGDRMRLIQVFGNLIANASRYSPANSLIQVSLSLDNGRVAVRVTDQGIGISEELRPRLFDTYSQGYISDESRTSGVGLGLAIVKGLVDLHGGAIEVESDGPGLGSAFTVFLPWLPDGLSSSST